MELKIQSDEIIFIDRDSGEEMGKYVVGETPEAWKHQGKPMYSVFYYDEYGNPPSISKKGFETINEARVYMLKLAKALDNGGKNEV